MNSPWLLITILVYLGSLIWVGAKKARTIRTQADFSLAGRGLPTKVLIGTLLATWIGTGSLFGNAEEAFRVGPSALIIPCAGSLGIFLLYFLAPRARQSNQMTLADIMESAYGKSSRWLTTLTLTCAYLIIVSYQYRAGASVVERLFPWVPHWAAITAIALFVIAYTALAGMFSVAYTDCANGILMIVGIGLAFIFLWPQAGGLEAIRATFTQNPTDTYSPLTLLSILLPSLLLIVGDANMHTRFFSAVDAKSARKATIGMFLGTLFLEWAIIGVAILGAVMVANHTLSPPENPGHIIVHLAFGALPAPIGILLCATILAVIISTADSYLLSPASSLSRDWENQSPHPISDATMVKMNRGIVVVLGVLAFILAFLSQEFFKVSLFAYTIYGAGITPAFLCAILLKPNTLPKSAGSLSILAGAMGAIGWKLLAPEEWIDPILPAVGLSSLVLLFGYLTQKKII